MNNRQPKPSESLRGVMNNGQRIGELSPALQSAIRMPIYRVACRVLDMPRARRKSAIEEIPENIREAVRKEVIRVYEYRRESVASKHNKDYY